MMFGRPIPTDARFVLVETRAMFLSAEAYVDHIWSRRMIENPPEATVSSGAWPVKRASDCVVQLSSKRKP